MIVMRVGVTVREYDRCGHTRTHMRCVDMRIDMCIDMRKDMCKDTSTDMNIETCVQACLQTCVCVVTHSAVWT